MVPYLILLVFVTATAYFGRRFGDTFIRRISLLIVGSSLILFAGLRDFRVGTDTGTYLRHFYISDNFNIVLERQDTGYYLLSWIARSFSESYAVLLILIALIVVPCYLSTIVRIVRRYETAVFLFITLGIYTFFFNGARQGIAAAICFLAIPFLLERKLWPYLALVLIAMTFHSTALIALPLYWIASPQIRWQRLAILGVSTVITVAFLNVFVGLATMFISDKYASYADAGEGGGQVWVTFFVCQSILLYYFKRIIPSSNEWYGRLLNIYLVGLVPALASTLSGVNPSGVLRLHLYFSSMAILLWPMVFHQIQKPALRLLLTIGFSAVTLAFFFLTTSTFSHLSPYRLNTSIFS